MPIPSTTLQRPDLGVTVENFDLLSDRAGFVGMKIMPVFQTPLEVMNVGRIPLKELLNTRETQRAARGSYNRSDWKFEDWGFATKENGWEEPVDDREYKLYQRFFDAELVAVNIATDTILRNAEMRYASKLFDTVNIFTGAKTGAGSNWNAPDSSTPVTDVDAACLAVWLNSGRWPNTIVMSRQLYLRCIRSAQIQSLVKFAGITDPSKINEQVLAQLFNLKNVWVAGGSKNTANKAAAAVVASIWDKTKALVCCVTDQPENPRDPCIGRTFNCVATGGVAEGRVEMYREDRTRSNVFRVRAETDETIMLPEMGYVLTGLYT